MTNWPPLLRYFSSKPRDTYFACLPKDINDLVEKYLVDDLLFTQSTNGFLQIDSFINGAPYYSIPSGRTCYTAHGNSIITRDKLGRIVEINLFTSSKKELCQVNQSGIVTDTSKCQLTLANKGYLLHNVDLFANKFYYLSDSEVIPLELDTKLSLGQVALDRSNDNNRHQVSFFSNFSISTTLNIYDLNEQRISCNLFMECFCNYRLLIMYHDNIYCLRSRTVECIDLRSKNSSSLGMVDCIIPYKDSIMFLYSTESALDESTKAKIKLSPYKSMEVLRGVTFAHSLSCL